MRRAPAEVNLKEAGVADDADLLEAAERLLAVADTDGRGCDDHPVSLPRPASGPSLPRPSPALPRRVTQLHDLPAARRTVSSTMPKK